MTDSVKEIFSVLSPQRFLISNEKSVQSAIENVFKNSGIAYKREVTLNEDSIIDFMIGDVGIEVKIKGQKRAIYKQCLRYSEFEAIKSIILVTSVNTGMPKQLNNKDVYILNISRAWL